MNNYFLDNVLLIRLHSSSYSSIRPQWPQWPPSLGWIRHPGWPLWPKSRKSSPSFFGMASLLFWGSIFVIIIDYVLVQAENLPNRLEAFSSKRYFLHSMCRIHLCRLVFLHRVNRCNLEFSWFWAQSDPEIAYALRLSARLPGFAFIYWLICSFNALLNLFDSFFFYCYILSCFNVDQGGGIAALWTFCSKVAFGFVE